MAAPRPGNTDRGWNDPPMFDYQGAASAGHMGVGASPQHTKLNKRVAFPMSPSPSSSVDPADSPPGVASSPLLLNPADGPPRLPPIQILPPISTVSTPTPVPVLVPSLSPTTTDPSHPLLFTPSGASPVTATTGAKVNVVELGELMKDLSLETDSALLSYVKEGLAQALDSVKHAVKGRALEDVRKKLGVMEECWTAGSLSPPVKSQLGRLVAALQKDEIGVAQELHLALMLNHTTEVHHWCVAVKHIVQELLTKKSELTESSQTDTDCSNTTDPCLDTPLPSVPTFTPQDLPDAPLPQDTPLAQDRPGEEPPKDSS